MVQKRKESLEAESYYEFMLQFPQWGPHPDPRKGAGIIDKIRPREGSSAQTHLDGMLCVFL
jgi:hypothetical protein